MNLNGLARSVAQTGLIEADKAQQVMDIAKSEKKSFISVAVKKGFVDALEVAKLASTEFGLPLLDLAAFDPELLVKDIVSNELIEKHRVLPLFKRGNRLFIAQSDPSNITAIDEIKFNTGMNVDPIVVEENKLAIMVERFVSAEDNSFDDFDDEDLDVDIENPEDAHKNDEPNSGDDAPIVRFVNKMLLDAIKGGSSDIHFEPYEKRYRVRYRTDGVLHEVSSPPVNLSGKIAARLKVMSQMDISERRVPQDGRIKMKISKIRPSISE